MVTPEDAGLVNGRASLVRFLVLGDARTGTTMVLQALNSHPHIRCYRELFNSGQDLLQLSLHGYDNFSAADVRLRDRDAPGFLRTRIFSGAPGTISAVGFKLLYGQIWGFPGLLEGLAADSELRVVHVKRENALRKLVSFKTAQRTGVWLQDGRRRLTVSTALAAARHPLRAARRLRGRQSRPRPAVPAERARLSITPEELFRFIVRSNQRTAHFDSQFAQQPTFTVRYEALEDSRDETFAELQAYLGVEPQPLTVTLQRQNPEPLSQLIANYDELAATLRDTPNAWFLEEDAQALKLQG